MRAERYWFSPLQDVSARAMIDIGLHGVRVSAKRWSRDILWQTLYVIFLALFVTCWTISVPAKKAAVKSRSLVVILARTLLQCCCLPGIPIYHIAPSWCFGCQLCIGHVNNLYCTTTTVTRLESLNHAIDCKVKLFILFFQYKICDEMEYHLQFTHVTIWVSLLPWFL